MEPVTTAIAAVTAASNAIAFIKARINDAQSVADISQQNKIKNQVIDYL